ncbi:HTH_Tnp_Tc3_2 domain-containing protein [Trichonephila clavipes]|nr:HTH_Tnp_Tc3_2 domain-containing protein [Trichonephila clavipes]
MCLNEEFVQLVSPLQIASECCYPAKSCCDTSCKKQNAYQHAFDFDKGRIVAHLHCGLLYHTIAASVGRYTMTVIREWNQWAQYGNTERRVGSQRPPDTSSREDRHVARIAVFKTSSVCTNSSTTFAATWTLSSVTMAASILDAAC